MALDQASAALLRLLLTQTRLRDFQVHPAETQATKLGAYREPQSRAISIPSWIQSTRILGSQGIRCNRRLLELAESIAQAALPTVRNSIRCVQGALLRMQPESRTLRTLAATRPVPITLTSTTSSKIELNYQLTLVKFEPHSCLTDREALPHRVPNKAPI